MTTPPATEPAAHGCEYCGERVQYIGTDHDMDGDYVAEYWCDNCKEYLHYVLPESDQLRARYRALVHTARTQDEGYELLDVAIRLGRMGYELTDDESDWQPRTRTHGGSDAE